MPEIRTSLPDTSDWVDEWTGGHNSTQPAQNQNCVNSFNFFRIVLDPESNLCVYLYRENGHWTSQTRRPETDRKWNEGRWPPAGRRPGTDCSWPPRSPKPPSCCALKQEEQLGKLFWREQWLDAGWIQTGCRLEACWGVEYREKPRRCNYLVFLFLIAYFLQYVIVFHFFIFFFELIWFCLSLHDIVAVIMQCEFSLSSSDSQPPHLRRMPCQTGLKPCPSQKPSRSR